MANKGLRDATYYLHGIINGVQNAIGAPQALSASIYTSAERIALGSSRFTPNEMGLGSFVLVPLWKSLLDSNSTG